MGIFDAKLSKELKLKKDPKDLYEFISKNPINTFLKYNLNVQFDSSTLNLDAELDNNYTLVITILIILSILFTYGLAIIPIIGFVYYQKIKATNHLKTLIEKYEHKEECD